MKRIYFINGWREGMNYFMGFGFTEAEVERMESGEVIHRGSNDFWIILEEEY